MRAYKTAFLYIKMYNTILLIRVIKNLLKYLRIKSANQMFHLKFGFNTFTSNLSIKINSLE